MPLDYKILYPGNKWVKKKAKESAIRYGKGHLSKSQLYQRTYGDYSAIQHQLKNPFNKTGWYDLYNRAAKSRKFQRGIFDRLTKSTSGEPVTPKKGKRPASVMPTPPNSKRQKTTRSTNRIEAKSSNMAKYSKKSKGKGNRQNKRKYRARVKRKSKKSSKYINMQSNHLSLRLAYKKPKNANVIKETRSMCSLTRRVGNWQTAAPGRQEVTNLYDHTNAPMGQGDLLELFTTGAKTWNSTTGTWITMDAKNLEVGDRTGKKLYIDSCNQIYDLTNQGPTSLYFKLYFVLPKISDSTTYDPDTSWAVGLTRQGANLENFGDVSSQRFIGARPTTAKLFNEEFTIVKCVTGKMDPGDERKIKFNYKPKRFVDLSYLWEHHTIKGLGPLSVMLVTHGVVADDSNTHTGGNITTTRTKLVMTGNFQYKGYVCDVRGRYSREVGTPFNTAAIGVGNILSIADASGNVVDSNVTTNFA